MPKAPIKSPATYIVPMNINGLEGRMLRTPSTTKKQREILLIYGHHALLERWWGLVENLNDFGNVTMPDLPGFGGMDSFYKLKRKPTIDNYADYLAAFIKMRYRKRKFSIVAISFGFLVVTRMLQKYPELSKRVELIVCMVGFMHRDDFLFSHRSRFIYRVGTRIAATRPVSLIIRYGFLNTFTVKTLYTRLPNAKRRFIEVEPIEFQQMINFDVTLWQANDVRTHWFTTNEFLNIDNCTVPISTPIWHIAAEGDHWLNNEIVKQHMLVVFKQYHQAIAKTKAHTPSLTADREEIRNFLPLAVRRALAK
jgi:pimeloyl-ACP methyl ester carboxylesterase